MPALELFQSASRAVSFFNTIALLWLGLTVLLNAERRRQGTWAAGGGLVLGGLFFAAHSVFIGRQLGTFAPEMEFWWRASWLPLIGPPYLWYLVMAWYTGKLRAGRHWPWLAVASFWGLVALALLRTAGPLPAYARLIDPADGSGLAPSRILGILGLYPAYSLLCIVLAIAALHQPETSERFMGDLGRRRAVPWLIAASAVLLVVTLAVGGVAAWFLLGVQSERLAVLARSTVTVLMGFDLLIAGLIAVAGVLMGRAIVSYEIFTGRTLPRSGLFRYWRTSLILAASYGAVVGGSLDLPIDPIYRLLLATVLMTVFFALLGWRSYAERERSMERLRPFVASPRLYDRLLAAGPLDVDIAAPFRALCDDVLGARLAYLFALGPMAPLVGPPLAHPAEPAQPLPVVAGLAARFRSPETLGVPLDPGQYGGAVWAVPLWSERGLVGALLLGEKRDGGLYTQEEIEIARASGQRLIDTQASAEMARRLMALQRQRLAENQVVDNRARRLLHDEVLPRLHTAMLALNGVPSTGSAAVPEVVVLLTEVHHEIANLLRAVPTSTAPEAARFGLIDALQREVEAELGSNFEAVTWQVEPVARAAAQAIPALAAEVMFGAAREAIRNAARHGRNGDPTRPLHLKIAVARRDGLELIVEDDGVGLVGATRQQGGSGQGLALHSAMMAVIGGTLTIESVPGVYTQVSLALPSGGGWLGTDAGEQTPPPAPPRRGEGSG